MNALSLVSGSYADEFYPFSLTRQVADIRCGILTIREKWEAHMRLEGEPPASLVVPGNLLPDPEGVRALWKDPETAWLQTATRLERVTDILRYHEAEMLRDYKLLTDGRISQPVSTSNHCTGTDIFLEAGAVVEHCFLNANTGP